jgi:hypothetical protein
VGAPEVFAYGRHQDFVGRIALAREVNGTLCSRLRGIWSEGAEVRGAGWSSLQGTAEHSGKGKNILYHFMYRLQGKTLIHHQGIICVVVFGRSSLRRIVHTAQSSLLVA